MADTTIDLLKNSSYVGKMDELIAAVKSGGGTASDVEWDNVKNKPTTIVGYGITDAKIDNGTITLGANTITPLTSAPVTSVNSKVGAVVLNASDIGAISTSDMSQTLGASTTKVPSEKAVSDALSAAGAGDMLKSVYDSDNSVANSGGIADYVANHSPEVLVCTISGSGTTASPYVCNKTTTEIWAAIQSGKQVVAQYATIIYNLVGAQGPQVAFFSGLTFNNSISQFTVMPNGNVSRVLQKIPGPDSKTDDMTQTVGMDADGKLWTAPGGGSGGGGFVPTLVASLVADGTTTSILQNIDIVYPAIYTVSIHAKAIADTENAGQTIFALFGGKTQFESGVTVRGIKTVNNTFITQLVALTFALDAEKKIRTIGKAESNADSLTNWDNYAEGGTLTSNAILLYSSTNKIIPAGYKCDVWRWM